ncbi:MAG: thioredoxin domain-containing protein [Proteobacteria bacterium]|nr:thioredoxin domain-containing protein [Pseudomonadota bacterium]
MKKKYLVAATGIILVALFAGAALIYNKQKAEKISASAQKNVAYLQRDYSPSLGNPDAKVTIVEFFDPACGTCRAFHPFVKQLMSTYKGKIRLVHRYLPLHQGSDYVIKILEAARLQNRYWETLEAAFDAQPVWASHDNPQPERLWMRLGNVGLNFKKVRTSMESPEIAARIRQDMADARQLQVNKTPGFFVNGEPLITFGYEQLQTLVESEINKRY